MLPLGYVCDKCNNYFARAVERPFLELPEIELLRSQEEVPSKKNRIPTINGLFNGIPVKLKKKVHHGQVIRLPCSLHQREKRKVYEHSLESLKIHRKASVKYPMLFDSKKV